MMKTIEEVTKEARKKAIIDAKANMEHNGMTLTADEYNRLGATYKLYALSLAVMLNHNNLKACLNDMNVSL